MSPFIFYLFLGLKVQTNTECNQTYSNVTSSHCAGKSLGLRNVGVMETVTYFGDTDIVFI